MCHVFSFNFQNNKIRYYRYIHFTTVGGKKTPQKVDNLPRVPGLHGATRLK